MNRAERQAAAEARAGLRRALVDLAAIGSAPPCGGWPQIWDSPDPQDRALAARACKRCPILEPCAAAAPFECAGVWAGRDRTDPRRTA